MKTTPSLPGLLRRFVVDWLDRADPGVCAEILTGDYAIAIGGHTLANRDDYVAATLGQLERFPSLLLTVHDLFTSGDCAALRFTEHGPSAAHEGQPAAWTGIGLFWWDGQRLTRNVTEEDYAARRRQFAEGVCDPISSPAPAPWSACPREPSPSAEAAVRRWLATGSLVRDGVLMDDECIGQPAQPLVGVADVKVAELFSAGDQVAFQAVQRGRYLGELPGTAEQVGRQVEVSAVGMVTVGAGGRIAGHVIRDRHGLRRRLLA